MSRRLCFVAANSFALNAFLAGPIGHLVSDGWLIDVIYNDSDGKAVQAIADVATLRPIPLARAVVPWRDCVNVFRLWRLFRRERYQVVHSITPKAGLLAMVAALMAGIPGRVHTFTGQVWATRSGPLRWLLRGMDVLLASCATHVLADSPSQRDFLIAEKVVSPDRLRVLGKGSICGVDVGRFRPDPVARHSVRARLGLGESTVVLLFLGRLHPEKGLRDLAYAFGALSRGGSPVALLLAGPDEGALAGVVQALPDLAAKLHVIGPTREPERYLAAADIFCLPSYREGFGLSLIEAGATGLPCVASRIYGITDAVEDLHTGLLVPPNDVQALKDAIEVLVQDPGLRERMGRQARIRAYEYFSRGVMLRAWSSFYETEILGAYAQR